MNRCSSTDMKALAKDQFEAWAGTYDRSLLHYFMFRPSYMAFMEEIAAWHREHPGPFSVLDIGCGTGTLAGWLTASPWPVSVVGMDYAEGMCREAARKAEGAHVEDRARFARGDSEHLPFADGSFDLVTCSNSFHHYPHQQQVVEEMRRVLRPRGRLMLIDGFRDNIIGCITFDLIIGRVEKNVYHAPWTVIHRYLETAGFTAIRHRRLNFWFPLLMTMGDAM